MNIAEHNSVLKLGVIGTGRIAKRFVLESSALDNITVNYVYNPNLSSAKKFAATYSLNFVVTLAELFSVVDAVYIASPHDTHYEYIKSAIINNKHVLCEKPMVLKKAQAEELFKLANQNNCVLVEAIKTAFLPGFIEVLKLAKNGKIGEIKDVEACFTKLTNSTMRELTDTISGGSFTELASYTLFAIIKLLGSSYISVDFESLFASNGVDIYSKAHFKYKDSMATSKTGLGVKSEGQLLIAGTKGYIRVNAPWWKTTSFEVCYEDFSKNEQYSVELLGDGLRYEINDFVSAIYSGKQCSELTHNESIAIAEIIDLFLKNKQESGY